MKKILLFLVAMFSIVALSAQSITKADWKFWEPTMEAIAKVESRQNPKAISKSGRYVGYLQVSMVLIQDLNEYYHTKYTANDRYSIQKSKEMFILVQKRYNRERNIQKAIRLWAGGCRNWQTSKTLTYYKKVMSKFNQTAYNLPDSL